MNIVPNSRQDKYNKEADRLEKALEDSINKPKDNDLDKDKKKS